VGVWGVGVLCCGGLPRGTLSEKMCPLGKKKSGDAWVGGGGGGYVCVHTVRAS